jgi:hypothetical protein
MMCVIGLAFYVALTFCDISPELKVHQGKIEIEIEIG